MIENTDFNTPDEPLTLFAAWFTLARQHEANDPNAMSLATVGDNGMPSVRMVLMKGYDAEGFTFFTNRESHKGMQLGQKAKAAVCFHWKSMRRQVRVEGITSRVSDAESDAYFATRPRGSQIGAWASMQSRDLENRATLEARVKEFEAKYADKDVPRPPHWGGYCLTPLMIEFWQDREFRLHDRITYRRDRADQPWTIGRLYP